MRVAFVSEPKFYFSAILLTFVFIAFMRSLPAQGQQAIQSAAPTQQPLITSAVDETALTTLKGNTHPLARREFDLGTAPASLPMERMLLVLKRSSEQEYSLRKLLDNQQDKKSPSYHKWLTPPQYGAQFGPSDADMQTITLWLQSHGFQVETTKGRSVLEFSGSASQVQEAFHTSIHRYIVNGEQHWANANDPSIPTALVPAVAGIFTLHDFIKKPTIHFSGEKIPATIVPGKKPQVTFPPQNGQPAINALAPQDFAVIYNINPIYNIGLGGAGSIGVVGRSNLFNSGSDVVGFLSEIGSGSRALGGGLFGIAVNGPDPGDLGGGEEAEATLDTTWSSAIAPYADVNLVVSATTNTTDGIDLSEIYIIENNFSDIMTESFSACELYSTDAQLAGASALAEQAAAQGITYLVSTGDNGAEGCDDPTASPATNPISVNALASTAFNVAVGGTMFNENGNPSLYWASTPPIAETAVSYIPEDVWNESGSKGLLAGSGGASSGNIQSGFGTTPGVAKPSWQSGPSLNIPADGVRDLPDVSLTAAGHDPYLLCLEGSCSPNSQGQISVYFVSGTSASTPAFAGIMSLVNQQVASLQGTTGTRQGLANYVLYRLAATQSIYPSQCNGSDLSVPPGPDCIFHDVTVGNNVVPGESSNSYQARSAYDLATGLGSVNVANLANDWTSVTFNPTSTTVVLNNGNPVSITHGQPIPITIDVTPNSGTGVPTGDAFLLAATGPFGQLFSSVGFWPLTAGSISTTINDLPGGAYSLSARYAGDATYAPSTSSNSNSILVGAEPSTTTVSVLSIAPNGTLIPFTSGPFGSFVYLRADVAGQSGYGIASGTVVFNDTFGAIPGGALFTLNGEGNTATPNGIVNFDNGTHTISANYQGDASFNENNSTQSKTFVITPGFFATVPSAQSVVVVASPGGSGASSVSVSNSSGFSGTIKLACSGLPSEATCTLSPASISATGTANTTTATITVTTTAATAALRSHRSYWPAFLTISMGIFFSTFLVGSKRHSNRLRLTMLMLFLVVAVPGCGGGGSGSGRKTPPPDPGTPAGTSTVLVTATSGSAVSTTGFTLVVQ